MAYVPKNVNVYAAAMAGAMAGMSISGNAVIVDPITGDYAPQALVAAAWSQAVDTAWGNVTVANSYDFGAIEFSSWAVFYNHASTGTPFSTQTNWTVIATAVVAMVQQGDTNASTLQNITFPGLGGGSNRAYGSGSATTAGQATITVIAAMKLIAKGSGIFAGNFKISWASLTAADVGTLTVKVFTDNVPGTPLTLGNVGAIGFGSNGVAQPGNTAVNNNGVFTANAGAGITITGANAGYTIDTTVITEGTAAAGALLTFDDLFGNVAPASGAETPFALGTTCLVTASLTNGTAARATGNITGRLFEV